MRLLLLGKNGQVGWELQRTLAPLGEVIALDHETCDFSQPDQIVQTVQSVRPNMIINAAAYTNVELAESEQSIAAAINATGPGILAEQAKLIGAPLIHFSTDYVFDGTKIGAYSETDSVNPLSIYGKTKWEGEQAIEAVKGKYLIFRTSWVYGTRGKNFLLTMRNLANKGTPLKIVSDQIGAPTWCRMIAEATSQVITQIPHKDAWGLYHMTAQGATSWHGFAEAIFSKLFCTNAPDVMPITAAEFPTKAKRPQNSCLSNQKLYETFNIQLPNWKSSLELCLE